MNFKNDFKYIGKKEKMKINSTQLQSNNNRPNINFNAVKLQIPHTTIDLGKLQSVANSAGFPPRMHAYTLAASDIRKVFIFGKNGTDEKLTAKMLEDAFPGACETTPFFGMKIFDESTFYNLTKKQLNTLGLDPNKTHSNQKINLRNLI
jgi:hypothetical protein